MEDVGDLDIQSLFHSDKIEQTYIGSVQRVKVVANANRVRRLFLIGLPENVCAEGEVLGHARMAGCASRDSDDRGRGLNRRVHSRI